MKKIFKIVLIALLLSGGITTGNSVNAQTSVSVSLSLFQRSLSPYGRWVNHGNYGQVWISNTRGFVPYQTGGHWAYTDYGWTWVSDYSWGWAPFHYGRWGYESGFGWYWVPDYNWGPAWVAWRSSNDYYGWAPLSPGLNVSVGVDFGNQIPEDRWVFAPHRYITSPYVYRYYAPRRNNVTIIRNTTVINNVVVKNNVHVDAGPRREDVERVNHTKIRTYTVANSSRAGKATVNKNTINIYKPVVNKTTVNNNNTTIVNKNSNNKTVNKSNNKTVVNKNDNNKTTVNSNNKSVSKTNNKTVNHTNKKPVNNHPANNIPHGNKAVNKPQHNSPANKHPNNDKKPPVVQKANKRVQHMQQQKQQNKNNQQVRRQNPPKQSTTDSNGRRNGKRK